MQSASPIAAIRDSTAAQSAVRPLRIGFVMSTEVGLNTQYRNWRAAIASDSGVDPEWIVIDWWKANGFLERLPGLPSGLKSRIRGRMQFAEGMRRSIYDALFIAAGHVLQGNRRALSRQPYFMTSDLTKKLLVEFGPLYGKGPTRYRRFERWKDRERRTQYCNAAALFPWSIWAAASMVEDYGADPSRVHVMPPGTDITKWSVRRQPDADGTVRILFVGGDFSRKGGDLLLDWARNTPRSGWQLHIVTRESVASVPANVIVHTGLGSNDPALIKLYGCSDIFALPTRGDCYSIASIEAMAAGLPVILSKTGGTGDIVRDGRTGFLIPPGDSVALADRLDYLIDHPERRSAMGDAARADAALRFDAARNIAKTVEIMRSCLEL